MKKEKVLVTGGLGYAGSVLVPKLLEKGYGVKVLDNISHENNYNLFLTTVQDYPLLRHPDFSFIKGDVKDRGLVKKLANETDSIIHLAAVVGAPASRKNKEETKLTNYQGTLNLLDSLSPKQKFVFASTGSIYGKIDDFCKEDSPLNPQSLYGETKANAEKEVLKKGGVAFRFATAFGLSPRLRLDLLPNDFSQKLVQNKALDIFESNARRTFIHVNDMADSYIFALENYEKMSGQAYNVGNEKMNMTKMQLAKEIGSKIKELSGQDVRIWEEKGRTDPDQRDYEVNYEKIQSVGKGFAPKITMEQGVEELVKFFEFFRTKDPFRNV